jgi:hypothetical protein
MITGLIGVGEPKIYNFQCAVKVDEEVFGFEIAMDDTELMQVLDASEELPEELTGLCFLEPFLFDDEFEELSLRDILHD